MRALTWAQPKAHFKFIFLVLVVLAGTETPATAGIPTFFQHVFGQAHSQSILQRPEQYSLAVLAAINNYRLQHNLTPLRLDPRLSKAAQNQADYMAAAHDLSHYGKNGCSPADRVREEGYQWSRIAENVAMGQISPQEVVRDWINSPAHRDNLLKPDITDAGVGFSNDYWSLTLARPAH